MLYVYEWVGGWVGYLSGLAYCSCSSLRLGSNQEDSRAQGRKAGHRRTCLFPTVLFLGRWVGGDRKVEEIEAVRKRCWTL